MPVSESDVEALLSEPDAPVTEDEVTKLLAEPEEEQTPAVGVPPMLERLEPEVQPYAEGIRLKGPPVQPYAEGIKLQGYPSYVPERDLGVGPKIGRAHV